MKLSLTTTHHLPQFIFQAKIRHALFLSTFIYHSSRIALFITVLWLLLTRWTCWEQRFLSEVAFVFLLHTLQYICKAHQLNDWISIGVPSKRNRLKKTIDTVETFEHSCRLIYHGDSKTHLVKQKPRRWGWSNRREPSYLKSGVPESRGCPLFSRHWVERLWSTSVLESSSLERLLWSGIQKGMEGVKTDRYTILNSLLVRWITAIDTICSCVFIETGFIDV